MKYVYILFEIVDTGFPDIGGDLVYDDFQYPIDDWEYAIVMLGQYGKVNIRDNDEYANVKNNETGDVIAYVQRYRVRSNKHFLQHNIQY